MELIKILNQMHQDGSLPSKTPLSPHTPSEDPLIRTEPHHFDLDSPNPLKETPHSFSAMSSRVDRNVICSIFSVNELLREALVSFPFLVLPCQSDPPSNDRPSFV